MKTRGKRKFHNWKEARRFRAIELINQGWKQSDICRALGVSRGAVSQWVNLYEHKGLEGLVGKFKSGAPSRLSSTELDLIPELLSHGAESYGFHGEIWSNPRIAHVIEREFGVQYHPHHVAKIMKELKWTPYMPIVRAKQRDEGEIERWRSEEWPRLKKSQE